MRVGVKRALGLVAIYAIALHTVLWGLAAPFAAAQTVDPFSVICHNGPQAIAAGETSPASPASVPTSACDHCTLCNATPAPAALDDVLAGYLRPAKQILLPLPAASFARDGETGNPYRARGPPQLT